MARILQYNLLSKLLLVRNQHHDIFSKMNKISSMQANSVRRAASDGKKKGSDQHPGAKTKPEGIPSPAKPPWPADRMSSKPQDVLADMFNGLSLQSLKERPRSTAIVYSESMLEHYHTTDPLYPECPDRIRLPYENCKRQGLVERCLMLNAKPVDESLLNSVHSPEHVAKMKEAATLSEEELRSMEHGYDDLSLHPKTPASAMLAAGAVVDLAEAVATDKIGNGFALIRPPGHHAAHGDTSGYCVFNNVALAAAHCLQKLKLSRVLVLDWDVHHGNGTQALFYNDPRVLTVSVHRYEHGWCWPNTRESDFDHFGAGSGLGYNINIPINKTGMSDSDYLMIFHQIIMPVALEFNPDAVIVAAGYDCALGCPQGEMSLTPMVFSHFVHKLKSLANGRLALALEGGYNLTSLSASVAQTVKGLLDDACPKLPPTEPPNPAMVNSVLNCINALRPYWKCFQYQDLDVAEKAISLASSDPRGVPKFVTEANRPAYYETNVKYPVQSADEKAAVSKRIEEIESCHPVRVTKNRTCYVYDEAMKNHRSILDPTHPERPDRISRIHSRLQEYGLLQQCLALPSRKATDQELGTVHGQGYIKSIRAIETTKPREFADLESKYNSIYLHKDSWSSAILSAGSLLNVVDSVMTNESRNGFAIIRPPGHHAERDTACGFCFFNNVPVAARYAQQKFNAKRVIILDWDVHHGNGTQHMFYEDPSVLYISLHRYDNGTFFPASPEANFDYVGKGKGQGYNINIPFNRRANSKRAPGDAEYLAAFQQIIMPVCYEYAPDLVLISAGFDAAKGDPLGGYKVSPAGYAHMTHMLSSLANGKVILALEGGYNLTSISESFSSCVHVMLGGAPQRLSLDGPDPGSVDDIKDVLKTHKQYWKSLCTSVTLPLSDAEIRSKTGRPSDDDVNKLADKLKSTALGTSPQKESPSRRSVCATTPVKPAPSSSQPNATTPSAKSQEQPTSLNSATESTHCAMASSTTPTGNSSASAVDPLVTIPEAFAVVPLSWCAHLEDNTPPVGELDAKAPCQSCGALAENWVCLTCYKVYCSRFVNEHMVKHAEESGHMMALSYADLSVWCYPCDAYVHHESLIAAKSSAHHSKFGATLPV